MASMNVVTPDPGGPITYASVLVSVVIQNVVFIVIAEFNIDIESLTHQDQLPCRYDSCQSFQLLNLFHSPV